MQCLLELAHFACIVSLVEADQSVARLAPPVSLLFFVKTAFLLITSQVRGWTASNFDVVFVRFTF